MNNFKIKKNRNKINISFLIVFIFIIFILFFFSNNLTNIFYSFSFPIQKSLANISNKNIIFFTFFNEKLELKKNNDLLEKERDGLISKIILLKETEKENKKLKQALNLNINDDFQLILAEVFSFNFNEDFIIVNKGLQDNISTGMPVINENKVIVGSVFQVYDKFSKVTLLTSVESLFFDAEIQEKDALGIIKGKGRFNLILDLISKEKDIKEGDLIVSMGEVFPKGLPVGKIKKIIKMDIDPFQHAELYPLFNPKNLKSVFIITDYQK
jgi:rod shape-determining protein MreC